MKIKDLFNVEYGINLELNKCEITDDEDGINFVSRTSQNNGVVAKVKLIPGKKPQSAGVLTCAGGGSVLSTFVQTKPFYSGRDLYILTPKKHMTFNEKIFYAMCIKKNAYKYNYGRQANKTLKDIELPDNVPDWVNEVEFNIDKIKTKNIQCENNISCNSWNIFKVGDIMDCYLGRPLHKRELIEDDNGINYVTRTSQNNGVELKVKDVNQDYVNEGNCITIGAEGITAFYQSDKFIVGNKISILRNKNLNIYRGIFIATVINYVTEGLFNYGRALILSKIKELKIKLPVDDKGEIDWLYMDNIVKELPYGDKII